MNLLVHTEAMTARNESEPVVYHGYRKIRHGRATDKSQFGNWISYPQYNQLRILRTLKQKSIATMAAGLAAHVI
jgi:hypothetical protein